MGWLPLITGCSEFLVNQFAFHPRGSGEVDLKAFDLPIRELFIETADGVSLQAFYLQNPDNNHGRVVLFLHGNAGNAAHRLYDAQALAERHTDVLLLGYRGYGKSTGSPNEQGVYEDARAALAYLEEQRGFPKQRIVILGRSLGSAIALEVAQQQAFAGLILVTPFSSARDMARYLVFPGLGGLAGDAFDSRSKITRILAPVMFIHGNADSLTPLAMGQELFDLCPTPKSFKVVAGAGHNNIILQAGQRYWTWIEEFMDSVAPPASVAFTTVRTR